MPPPFFFQKAPFPWHDDVIKWKHFPRYWPFVRRIHRSPVNSSHKGQWRGALMFSLICVWINNWANNGEAGDLRRYRIHYDVTVMNCNFTKVLFKSCHCHLSAVCIIVKNWTTLQLHSNVDLMISNKTILTRILLSPKPNASYKINNMVLKIRWYHMTKYKLCRKTNIATPKSNYFWRWSGYINMSNLQPRHSFLWE